MQLVERQREGSQASLDRGIWHKPLVSIIITHKDYSSHVEGALLSILDQTHDNWECVIVDDGSDAGHLTALKKIVAKINDPRISIHALNKNVGQIPAFFAGLEVTTGDFVCLLDPDDRYAETFLADAFGAHIGSPVMCPIVSTEQYLVTARGVIGAGLRGDLTLAFTPRKDRGWVLTKRDEPLLIHVPAAVGGWHWTSTSSMMFRRAALTYMRPHKTLTYNRCADGYLAQGAHVMGGTLFLAKPLVYRMLHDNNAWITEGVYASSQNKQREGAEQRAPEAFKDVIEAINHNGLTINLTPPKPQEPKKNKEPKKKGIMRHPKRWTRSIKKKIGLI